MLKKIYINFKNKALVIKDKSFYLLRKNFVTLKEIILKNKYFIQTNYFFCKNFTPTNIWSFLIKINFITLKYLLIVIPKIKKKLWKIRKLTTITLKLIFEIFKNIAMFLGFFIFIQCILIINKIILQYYKFIKNLYILFFSFKKKTMKLINHKKKINIKIKLMFIISKLKKYLLLAILIITITPELSVIPLCFIDMYVYIHEYILTYENKQKFIDFINKYIL